MNDIALHTVALYASCLFQFYRGVKAAGGSRQQGGQGCRVVEAAGVSRVGVQERSGGMDQTNLSACSCACLWGSHACA